MPGRRQAFLLMNERGEIWAAFICLDGCTAPVVGICARTIRCPGPVHAEVLARRRTGVVTGIHPFTWVGPDLPRFPEQKWV